METVVNMGNVPLFVDEAVTLSMGFLSARWRSRRRAPHEASSV